MTEAPRLISTTPSSNFNNDVRPGLGALMRAPLFFTRNMKGMTMYPSQYDVNAKMEAAQQLQAGAIRGTLGSALSQPKDRNPDSIPSRLDQVSHGLDDAIRMASRLRDKLFGSTPSIAETNIAQMGYEPAVSMQIDMNQGRITELVSILEGILKNF